jgi:hypothetical protein
MDELVWAVCTATPCHRNTLARWAENVLSSYCFCCAVIWATPCIFVCAAHPGQLGQPAHIPGIVTGIPREYQCHHKVFLDQQATHFPPSRPEDHAIKLVPGAPETINYKVYPLTLVEQEVTKKFLKENEWLGYIEKMDLPWSLPWFFIKKKDGTL